MDTLKKQEYELRCEGRTWTPALYEQIHCTDGTRDNLIAEACMQDLATGIVKGDQNPVKDSIRQIKLYLNLHTYSSSSITVYVVLLLYIRVHVMVTNAKQNKTWQCVNGSLIEALYSCITATAFSLKN